MWNLINLEVVQVVHFLRKTLSSHRRWAVSLQTNLAYCHFRSRNKRHKSTIPAEMSVLKSAHLLGHTHGSEPPLFSNNTL